MKKLLIITVLVTWTLCFAASLDAQDTKNDPCFIPKCSLSIGAGVRNFSESGFKDVYGSSPITYSIDFGVKIWKNLEAFLHTDYLKKNGKLTFTQEASTLKIFPLELGARYLFSLNETCKVKLFPYLGAGAGYYMIKEDNPIGNLDEKRTGFFVEGGLRFYLVKSFFIDAKLKDVMVKTKAGIKTGGFAYMAGLGISF
jgi:outer membrane protein W